MLLARGFIRLRLLVSSEIWIVISPKAGVDGRYKLLARSSQSPATHLFFCLKACVKTLHGLKHYSGKNEN
jgi:hypothetical protein